MSTARLPDGAGGTQPEDLVFRWLSLATTAAVFLLILLGGTVRATGSSLACGDWPLCQGQLIPPFSGPAAIEFAHRLAGLVVGALVAGVALFAWRAQRERGWVVVPATTALGLLLAQMLLGGLEVRLALPPAVAVAHLAAAEGILAALVVSTVAAFERPTWPEATRRSGFATLSRVSAGAVFVVLLTGSAVASSGIRPACTGWPFCQPETIGGDLYLSGLQVFHRLIVAVGGALVAAVVVQALQLQRGRPLAWLGRSAATLAVLYAVQAGLGAAAVLSPLPELVGVLHLAAGTGVWATLVAIAVLAYGEPRLALTRAFPEPAPRGRPTAGADTHLSVWGDGPVAESLDLSVGSLAPVPVGAAAAYPSGPAAAPFGLSRWLREEARVYVELTKPRIIVLLLITTVAGLLLASPPWPNAGVVVATLVGGALAAGGANALNQYHDRDVDELMRRTRRRPLPSQRVTADEALVFGVSLGTFSFLLLAAFVNLLAASLSLLGLLFYVFVYTILLKRTTPQNIVIGGAAGAIPPLVGWAAARGELSLAAYVLFAIVFFWTPPHFWSLSIMTKRDYQSAGIPMLPVVAGDDEARWQILIYAIALAVISLGLFAVRVNGLFYLGSALALGAGFVWMAYRQVREANDAAARRTFLFSNAYLALLFLAMVVDHLVAVL